MPAWCVEISWLPRNGPLPNGVGYALMVKSQISPATELMMANSAIQKYLNSKKVPQLFVATGATKWNDPKNFPWTIGWQPSYQSEARIYAKYLIKEKPGAKVAILYQNDDFGKDYLKGLKDGFGDKGSMIVAEESYETSEPTIDGHIVKLKATGADVFINIATPKFAAQAIKKVAEIDWKPLHLLTNVSASVGGVMKPAGYENSQGIISAAYAKDGADPQWDNDPGMKKFYDFLAKYYPEGNKIDGSVVYGYGAAQTLVKVMKAAPTNDPGSQPTPPTTMPRNSEMARLIV